jgi:hypothetical protein
MATTTSFVVDVTYSVQVVVTDTVTLLFDGGPGPITKTGIPQDNDNDKVCTITAVTSSGAPYTQPITMSGTDAAKFALTNGGVCPCDLLIGPADLPAGTNTGTLRFTAPAP